MTPIKTQLWDSVSLTSVTTDKFKTGMISFSLRLPLSRESSAYNMLLSGVLRRGCEEFPSAALLNRRLDELYASSIEIKTAKCGKNQLFIISAEMLDNSFVSDGTDILDGVAHLISQVLLHPLTEDGYFRKETVCKEKNTVRDAIKAEMNNPRAYASLKCAELMHLGDGDFPTADSLLETVDSADEIKLYRHYKEMISASALDIFYVGSQDASCVSNTIKRHFGEFCGKASAIIPIAAEKFTHLKESTEPFEVSQGKLCLGFRVGVTAEDKKYFAASMFNEIFGGSPASKLFTNVRERLSLCYYCASSYDPYLGNITVSSGINVRDLARTKAEILRQLEAIRSGEISEDEFLAAKKAILHWYRQIYDYPFELFAFYNTRSMLGINASPEEYMRAFGEVTVEDVIEVAKGVQLDTVFFLEGTLDGSDGDEEDCEE